jgi:transcriptional regulator with XRE-family HTH domain
MIDAKVIVAENLAELRKARGLTQAQLAEKFNYSDKAVCRWEKGDTLPDINILCALADFYGVTMNDLVDPEFEAIEGKEEERTVFKYRVLITSLLLAAVWLLTVVFFITSMMFKNTYWIIFIWAIPASCFSILRIWRGNRLHPVLKIIIYSVMIWTVITAIFLHLLVVNGVNSWMIYLIGIPLEFMVISWQQVKRYRGGK